MMRRRAVAGRGGASCGGARVGGDIIPLPQRGVHVCPGGEEGREEGGRYRRCLGGKAGKRMLRRALGVGSVGSAQSFCGAACAVWASQGGLVRRQEAAQRQIGVRGRSLRSIAPGQRNQRSACGTLVLACACVCCTP